MHVRDASLCARTRVCRPPFLCNYCKLMEGANDSAMHDLRWLRCREQLHHHDWQEAVFALYSSDGQHLKLLEFARLIQVEYDHGKGRNQLPKASWADDGDGRRRWARFCAHFGCAIHHVLNYDWLCLSVL